MLIKKNTNMLLIVTALVTVLLFTGCSSNAESTTESTTGSSVSESTKENVTQVADLAANISTARKGNNQAIPTQSDEDFDPIWVPSSITVDDTTWNHVDIYCKFG